MKTYKVEGVIKYSVQMHIEAESYAEAERMGIDRLEDGSIDGFSSIEPVNDYEVCSVERQKMNKKIRKLTKKELIELVRIIKESDLPLAKAYAEWERGENLELQKKEIENTSIKQIKKEIKASNARQCELYRQYEAQRRSEQADEK